MNVHKNRSVWGMTAYAILNLVSMASMSIGVLILAFLLATERGGIARLLNDLKICLSTRPGKLYLKVSFPLILACFMSLLLEAFFPLQFGSYGVEIRWPKDLAKLSYWLLPPLFSVGWMRLNASNRTHVLRAWLIAFGVLSTMGIIQFFTGWPRAQANPLLEGYYHPILFLGHHLSVASVWIFPFFVLFDLTFRKTHLEVLPKKVSLFFLASSLFVLVFSFSRTLWIALPAGLLVWMIFQVRFRLSALIILITGLSLAGIARIPLFARRLAHPMGVNDRIHLWRANLEFFLNRPWFGVGLGKNHEFSVAYFNWTRPNDTQVFYGHAHNLYLEILAGLGIIGSLAWILWMMWMMGSWFKLYKGAKKHSPFALGVFCAWIVFLINGLTQVNFWEGKVLHQVMWMTGLLLANLQNAKWDSSSKA